MPTALMTGSFERADPGRETVLRAMWRALPGWKAVVPSEVPARVHPLRARLAGARSTLRFDATVVTGGVFEAAGAAVSPPPPGPLESAATTATLALGRPSALVGISAPPIRGRAHRALARALARRSGLLILRDTASARALAEAGVPGPFRIGADPAWAAIGEPAAAPTADRVTVVLCPAAVTMVAELVEALAPLAQAGLEIDLLPWRGQPAERGRDFVSAIAAALGASARVLARPRDLAEVREAVSGSRLVVGFRHHALVAAAAAGAPFVAVGREPGLEPLAAELGQAAVGVPSRGRDLGVVFAAAIESEPPAAATVRERIDRARHGLRLLSLVLSGGRAAVPHEIEGLPLEPAPGQ
jgi:polysaccharide pyruvyl transferase WcaK-like protein